MADLDRLLSADISDAAAEAVEPPDFARIVRRGAQRRRTHTLATAAAASVVIALVAAGGSLVIGHESSAPQPASPASPGPPSAAFGSMPAGDGANEQKIEPGTYRIPSSEWSAVDFTVTFPEGWTVQYGHIYHRYQPDEELSLEAAVVDAIFTHPCRGERAPVVVGPRVQDLVTALERELGPVTSRPVTTTLGGHPATRVDLRVPQGVDLTSCRLANDGDLGLQIWYSEPTDNYFVLFPDARASVYILDVGGRRQVFVTQNRSPDSPEARGELQTVLDSIRIAKQGLGASPARATTPTSPDNNAHTSP